MTTRPTLPVVPPEPGDHLCVFYRGPVERARLMSAYLDDGLRVGQACLWVADTAGSRTARSVLTDDDATDDDAAEDAEGVGHQHLPTGAIAPEAVTGRVAAWSRAALRREGRAPARVVADMSWAAATAA